MFSQLGVGIRHSVGLALVCFAQLPSSSLSTAVGADKANKGERENHQVKIRSSKELAKILSNRLCNL